MNKSTYIKKKFMNSFLVLIKIKPADKISITEVALNAKLTRQTFYRHFNSIDELICFIHISNVSVSYELAQKFGFSLEALTLYLGLISSNKYFYKRIINLNQRDTFIRMYIKRNKRNIIKYFLNCNYNEINEDVDLLFSIDFYTDGFSQAILKWIENDCILPYEDLAKFLLNNIPKNLEKFINIK